MCVLKWTTRKVRQIGRSAWHFRRKFAPPLLPSISAYVCTASPPPRQNHRVKEYRVPNIFFNRAENFFLQIGQYGYLKMQNFTRIPNPKAKIKKKHSTKKLFTKNCPFASFCKIILYFSQFRLQIWNENKILHILVPILTYFNTNYFFQNTVQIFFLSSRSIWVPKNAEFYSYSKSEN